MLAAWNFASVSSSRSRLALLSLLRAFIVGGWFIRRWVSHRAERHYCAISTERKTGADTLIVRNLELSVGKYTVDSHRDKLTGTLLAFSPFMDTAGSRVWGWTLMNFNWFVFSSRLGERTAWLRLSTATWIGFTIWTWHRRYFFPSTYHFHAVLVRYLRYLAFMTEISQDSDHKLWRDSVSCFFFFFSFF